MCGINKTVANKLKGLTAPEGVEETARQYIELSMAIEAMQVAMAPLKKELIAHGEQIIVHDLERKVTVTKGSEIKEVQVADLATKITKADLAEICSVSKANLEKKFPELVDQFYLPTGKHKSDSVSVKPLSKKDKGI